MLLLLSSFLMSDNEQCVGPFSYVGTGLMIGVSTWYYDYWRRRATEEIMYDEDNSRYHSKISLNNALSDSEGHQQD